MKCKYYAISKEEILKRLEKWDGIAYLSGYSNCTILDEEKIQTLRKNLADFASKKKLSPCYVDFLACNLNYRFAGPLKRSYAIRDSCDKMHVKSVTAMRWLYESFVNEVFARSPYKNDALAYVHGIADAGIVMDPFEVIQCVREYLAETVNTKKAPK